MIYSRKIRKCTHTAFVGIVGANAIGLAEKHIG